MKRDLVACVLAAVVLAAPAHAQDAGTEDAGGAADAGAEAAQSPHAAHGMMEPPEDGAVEDPSVPAGTIAVQIADDEGKPLPRAEVTLGILYNSVAKGESRKRVTKTANEEGIATFDSLDSGSGVAYRAMVFRDGATFSIPPFQLPEKTGMKARLHVYPVTSEIREAMLAMQAIVYAEVKDDRVQVQQAYRIFNIGRNAWVPNDLVVPLPPEFTAFTAQQGMTDVGVDAVPGRGVRIRGTFGPGQHVVEFRWQMPYSGDDTVRLDVGMPPNVASARVIAPSSKTMSLEVPGFPAPQPTNDGTGQRVLITEKQLRRDEPMLSTVSIVIKGLPTIGPGRMYASALAAMAVLVGILLGTKKTKPGQTRKDVRAKILADLEALERAQASGAIGPKTYERARRELIDDLAREIAAAEPKASRKAGRRRVTA